MNARTTIMLAVALAISLTSSWMRSDSLPGAAVILFDFWGLASICAFIKFVVLRLFRKKSDILFDLAWMATVLSVVGFRINFFYRLTPKSWLEV